MAQRLIQYHRRLAPVADLCVSQMHILPCSSSAWLSFEAARALPRNFVSFQELPERTTSISLGVPGPISRWDTSFLFEYDIFPQTIMRSLTEWRVAGRSMSVADIIIQRVLFPPIGWGLCLQFAVKIKCLFQEHKKIGFAYETLLGHVEGGVSEFYFDERSDGIYFTIHTFSRPSHWTSRLVRYVFTQPYQAWCTRSALSHVKQTFINSNTKSG